MTPQELLEAENRILQLQVIHWKERHKEISQQYTDVVCESWPENSYGPEHENVIRHIRELRAASIGNSSDLYSVAEKLAEALNLMINRPYSETRRIADEALSAFEAVRKTAPNTRAGGNE